VKGGFTMKKNFLRFIALVLAVMLLAMPSTTVLAASQPVLVYHDPSIGLKCFEYQPTSLIIQPGSADILRDVSNSAWYIHNYEYLYFYMQFDFLSTYRWRVIETQPTNRVITDFTGYTDATGIGLQVPESGYYILEISPETSLGAFIKSYSVQIQ
jgi:hypothetical protein